MPGGVSDPDVIDLIAYNPHTDVVTLYMVETRPWGEGGERIPDLRAKLETYLAYAGDGRLARDYPQAAGKPLRFQIECRDPPGKLEGEFLREVRAARLEPEGIRLVIRTIGEGR